MPLSVPAFRTARRQRRTSAFAIADGGGGCKTLGVRASRLRLLAAAVGLLSFAAPPAALATAQRQPSRSACTIPGGWTNVAARGTRYVIFGEIHGTGESPAFVARLACGLASRGERLLIGIEQQASDNAALQQAWSLPDGQFAAALRRTGWAGRLDGVASRAMFGLLLKLHALKARGRAIDVVAFNGFRDDAQRRRFADLPAQGPHEAAQAENIRRAAESGRYDHVLILVGNLHARKTPVGDGAAAFRPMAMQLAPAAEITSLNMRASGGSMWNCLARPGARLEPGKPIPPSAIDCGSHDTGRSPVDLGRHAFIRLGAFPGEPADPSYDGFYWLGRVKGSPPAAARSGPDQPLHPPRRRALRE
jgi:hypothetical protein